jgi:hypothetical protein
MPKKMCKLHGIELKRRKVPILYGMQPYDPASAVLEELFPNSFTQILGGCGVDDSFPSEKLKYVCDECRLAEENWRRENDVKDL